MSLIGGIRYTSASGSAAESPSDGRIVNFIGFPISGHTNSNAVACCLYVWNPTNNQWEPCLQPATS